MYRVDARTRQLREWADMFHKNGYLILDNAVATEDLVAIRADLTRLNRNHPSTAGRHTLHKCFVEQSPAAVRLIGSSVLSDFAEFLLSDLPNCDRTSSSLSAHVFHCTAFSVPPSGRGQAPNWHTDDPPHNVVLPPNYTLPEKVCLPVMACTFMIWLSDCSLDHGPTHIQPGSHRWGQTKADCDEAKAVAATGLAGTAVLVNSQTWHRGASNTATTSRDTLQISWGRRLVGHKYKSIMNYVMPERVLRGASPQLRQRLGFLPPGAYS